MGYFSGLPVEIQNSMSRARDPVEVLSVGGGLWSDQLTFYIPWDYRWTFMRYIAGTEETFPLSGGGSITRTVPLRHPEAPDDLFAVGASAEGMGGYFERTVVEPEILDGLGHKILYSHARVTVDFATMAFGVEGDQPFAELNLKHSSEYWTKPGTAWVFSDSSKSTQDVGVLVPTTTYQLTTYQNPTLNSALLRSYQGKINSTILYLAGEAIPAGTVRFDGAETTSAKSTLGAKTHVKRMAFTWRDVHWNLQMRADGVLDTPINIVTGLPPYQLADLNALLA